MDDLLRIKRLVVRRQVRFTSKARDEMKLDGLTADDVLESIVNARRIDKIMRSRSVGRSRPGEKLYVIKSRNYSGTLIYMKGRFGEVEEAEVFYVLISATHATAL
ncbi:hypothetical protein RAS1_10940 [Phycisphaerae bacterium RAS1]|nr:hypothetical protein RAS1_10940 [Phycisphaerae bacterium RAS1]